MVFGLVFFYAGENYTAPAGLSSGTFGSLQVKSGAFGESPVNGSPARGG